MSTNENLRLNSGTDRLKNMPPLSPSKVDFNLRSSLITTKLRLEGAQSPNISVQCVIKKERNRSSSNEWLKKKMYQDYLHGIANFCATVLNNY